METRITFGDTNSGFQAGVINGPVELHLAPERLETPLTPTSTVPFRRDVDFVDRKIILDQIHKKCAIPGSWTALVGLGGVGKSQLAIEFAYRTREQFPGTWVFWVHASNAARFEQGFRDIANCVKIPGWRDAKADIFQLVHDWFRDSEGQWLLILDNIDDATFLLNAQSGSKDTTSRTLREYLPQTQTGCILITTRSSEAALNLVERSDVISVDPMNKMLALELFEKKLGAQENDRQDVSELAEALEFMPLAIVQAAAYIAERAPRYSLQVYLEQFRKSDHKKTSLLDHGGGWLRRDREAKNSIIITWQISFDYLRATRPSAADLLSLMCFFDRQGIPESLLRVQVERDHAHQDRQECHVDDDKWSSDEDNLSKSSLNDTLEGDIVALRNFSFISINADGKTFEMHRLVQLATLKWLGAHGQLERWKRNFMRNLCEEFPTGQYENWALCQSLFPHAKSAGAQRPDEADSLKDWASILYNAAWYAEMKGNLKEAENMSVQSLRARKKILGLAHEDTLWSMALVADAYSLQGRFEEAEKLRMQVLEMRKTKLGQDHPDTLTSMSNLAVTYSNQGRWGEAEKLQVQVVKSNEMELGAEHLHTLISMDNLAYTYRNQGRWKEAEELEVQVLRTSQMKFGADHPDTLTSMGNLALTYSRQGRYEEAKELELQVLKVSKTKLGTDHPDTLTSMSNLAMTYSREGRYEEAKELGLQVLEMSKMKLGTDHPNTLTSMGNLALTYSRQGQYEEAKELELQVLEMSKTKLGVEHPDTLIGTCNLAFTLKSLGRDAEAIGLLMESVRLQERKLGANHPSFTYYSNALAKWEAEQEADRVLV